MSDQRRVVRPRPCDSLPPAAGRFIACFHGAAAVLVCVSSLRARAATAHLGVGTLPSRARATAHPIPHEHEHGREAGADVLLVRAERVCPSLLRRRPRRGVHIAPAPREARARIREEVAAKGADGNARAATPLAWAHRPFALPGPHARVGHGAPLRVGGLPCLDILLEFQLLEFECAASGSDHMG